jgi:hypothetical protein
VSPDPKSFWIRPTRVHSSDTGFRRSSRAQRLRLKADPFIIAFCCCSGIRVKCSTAAMTISRDGSPRSDDSTSSFSSISRGISTARFDADSCIKPVSVFSSGSAERFIPIAIKEVGSLCCTCVGSRDAGKDGEHAPRLLHISPNLGYQLVHALECLFGS